MCKLVYFLPGFLLEVLKIYEEFQILIFLITLKKNNNEMKIPYIK